MCKTLSHTGWAVEGLLQIFCFAACYYASINNFWENVSLQAKLHGNALASWKMKFLLNNKSALFTIYMTHLH